LISTGGQTSPLRLRRSRARRALSREPLATIVSGNENLRELVGGCWDGAQDIAFSELGAPRRDAAIERRAAENRERERHDVPALAVGESSR
jgi:hypothetical protein